MFKNIFIVIILTAFSFSLSSCGESLNYDQINYGYKIKYLKVGIELGKIAYIDEGTGDQTLLFIHGIGNYLKYFKHQISFFKKHYRVIALDMPGYGKSTFNKKIPYSYTIHANSIISFAQKLKLKNLIVLGHSYGGMVTNEIASRNTLDIKKIVLLAPGGLQKFKQKDINSFLEVLDENTVVHSNRVKKAYQTRMIANETEITDRFLDELMALIKSGAYNSTYITRTRALISMIKTMNTFQFKFQYLNIPILILFGENDKIVPIYRFNRPQDQPSPKEFFTSLETVNPNATVKMINNCGHLLILEKPNVVNKLILNFLKQS